MCEKLQYTQKESACLLASTDGEDAKRASTKEAKCAPVKESLKIGGDFASFLWPAVRGRTRLCVNPCLVCVEVLLVLVMLLVC